METCWWRRRRRRRRRQPEGSQRPERQRQRPEHPDPRPHPGAGRATRTLARRRLLAGERSRGTGGGGGGPGGVGSPSGAGAAGRRAPLPAPGGAAASWGGASGPGERRPAGAAGWLPGSALWPREPASGSGGRLLALPPCFQPRSCRVGRVAFGSFPHSCREEPSASGVGAVPSLYPWGPSRYKVQCRPPTHHVPPARSPSPPAMPAVFKRNNSWSVPAEAGE